MYKEKSFMMSKSLIYKLNVTYFNQVEDIQKFDQYMTSYNGEDATISSSGDKSYTVTGHVPEKNLFVFDPLPAITSITNLSKVKVTVGDESHEITDITQDGNALMDFLKTKIPFEVNFDPIDAILEITAGKETVVYDITFTTDYNQQVVASKIIDDYYKDGFDNDEIKIINESADGISWIDLELKKSPSELTDQLGWVDMVKSIPYLGSIEFGVDGTDQKCTITDVNNPEQLSLLKSTMIAGFPVDNSIDQQIGNIFYRFTNTGDNESHQTIVSTMFYVKSVVPHQA